MNRELRELDDKTLVSLIHESCHLITLHYGIWFRETEHQLGLDKAIAADDIAWQRALPGIMEQAGSFPVSLAEASRDELEKLLLDLCRRWYVHDGVWFQAVENSFDYEMHNAKRINDSCWARFSYIEAKRLLKVLGLPDEGGLPVLRQAIKYRQYSLISPHEFVEADEHGFVFRIKDCRVQTARRRKGLPEYPCRSAGYVEYARFAESIDARIRTTCVSCPPDPHPEEWCCAWKFEL